MAGRSQAGRSTGRRLQPHDDTAQANQSVRGRLHQGKETSTVQRQWLDARGHHDDVGPLALDGDRAIVLVHSESLPANVYLTGVLTRSRISDDNAFVESHLKSPNFKRTGSVGASSVRFV